MQINDYDSYENVNYDTLDFDDRVLREVSFYRCTFAASTFQYAQLFDCEFQECLFEGCNLSLVLFANSKIIDTEFKNSKLLGINWGNLGPVIVAKFFNCLMDRSAFSGQNLMKVKFAACSLQNASFSDSNLSRVEFDDCDFSGCQFHQTNLSSADFSSSRNYFINAETNKINKAIFSLPEAVSLLANLGIELK